MIRRAGRFAILAGLTLLSGCATTAPTVSALGELEPLYWAKAGHDDITIRVSSNGCTQKADFAFFVDRKDGEITLAFDVPQSAAAETPFATWCSRGQALAQALDAALYDDSGQPFQASAFAAIEQELERLYTALAERDLAAGSGAARRLFS